MSSSAFPYPPGPSNPDVSLLLPTPAFRKATTKVVLSLLFFGMVYLLLFSLAGTLAVLLVFVGVQIIFFALSILGIALGVACGAVGLMLFFFFIKFIFSRNQQDFSGLMEISEAEEPHLFAFIRKLTTEIGTPFPNKIYLSPDVNAGVSFNSTFFSMFFPSRKNLTIGLGLVNSLNVSELKAVLAHEFGHFSQKSMRLGSYVYNVNRVIHNLLFENEGYERMLEKFGNTIWIAALLAHVVAFVLRGAQAILREAYKVVQKSYMGLSRQMEFHADTVAAFAAGSQPLVSSLRRLEAADICYDALFKKYSEWVPQGKKPANLYPHFTEVMQHFSREFEIPLNHGLLAVNAESLAYFNQSKLNIKNQWASHPATEDRVAHLNELGLEVQIDPASAWELFSQGEPLQEKMTEKVFSQVKYPKPPELLDLPAFQEKYLREYEEWSFHPLYKGFYNDRDHTVFNPEEEIAKPPTPQEIRLEELLSEQNVKLPGFLGSLRADQESLETISGGKTGIKTFDFDGRKYHWKKAKDLVPVLEKEILDGESKIAELDKALFRFFYQKALIQGKEADLLDRYHLLFRLKTQVKNDRLIAGEVWQALSPIYTEDMDQDAAYMAVKQLNQKEVPLKKRLKAILENDSKTPFLDENERKAIKKYVAKTRKYILPERFNDPALEILQTACSAFTDAVTGRYFKVRKAVLDFQAAL